jgi:hypothetical protein
MRNVTCLKNSKQKSLKHNNPKKDLSPLRSIPQWFINSNSWVRAAVVQCILAGPQDSELQISLVYKTSEFQQKKMHFRTIKVS